MKIIKIILGIILAIVGLFLILGLFAPKQTSVKRTLTIDASPKLIWDNIYSLQQMDAWSPWNELDPNQTKTFEGTPGEIGSVSAWEGNDDVGKGSQTITAVKEGKWVETNLKFIEPFESEAIATISLDKTENGTAVTWGFNSESAYPMNTMNLFLDMDAMLGADFEKGLKKLETIIMSEKANLPANNLKVEEVDLATMVYIGYRDSVLFPDMQPFFAKHFGALAFAIKPNQMIGMPSALYFYWDPENQQADMMAAIQVNSSEITVDGYEVFEFEGGKALRVDYYGDYEGVEEAHMVLDQYLNENNLEMREPAIEEYITDPGKEPDPSKWLTRVTYLLKE